MQKKLKLNGSMMTSRNNTKKDVLFIIGDWNAKVGSQEIPGLTGNFGLGVQNEVLTEICQDNTPALQAHSLLSEPPEKSI